MQQAHSLHYNMASLNKLKPGLIAHHWLLRDRQAKVTDAAHLQIPQHLDLFQLYKTPALLVDDNLSACHCQQKDKLVYHPLQ
jgi:hypothetical protein